MLKIKRNLISFESVAESWLLYKKYNIKDSTYYRYKYIIYKYLIPSFGKDKLSYFKNYDFNVFIEQLANNLSTKTIKDIIIVFKSILKYSERKYNFDFKLDLISTPRLISNDLKILSPKEKMKLEKKCYENYDFKDIGILICLYTGIRIGEICALTWDNINLEKKELIINKTMQRIYVDKKHTMISIDTPKSQKSNRIIPISNKLYQILKDLKRKNNFKGDEFFLTGSDKKFIEPRSYQYTFKKVLENCGIPQYKFHILRHTFATNCIQIGMDIKSLSEVLGHANVNITLNKYVHSSINVKKKYLEKL